MQCQCLTKAGLQCRNRAQAGGTACHVHKNNCVPISTAVTTSVQSKLQPNTNWLKVAKKYREPSTGYEYWIIPANTLLYKGTRVTFPDDTLPEAPSFYATLDVASYYAFEGEKYKGEYGKVITARTTDDIRVLDLSSLKSLNQLRKKLSPNQLEDLDYAFGTTTEVDRYSNETIDKDLVEWVCRMGFEGFGYPKIKSQQHIVGFHNEVVICKNDKLVRGDLEYRVIAHEAIGFPPPSDEDDICVYEISKTQGLTRILPPDVYSLQKTHNRGTSRQYTQQKNSADKYIPEIRPKAKSLCSPVIKEHKKKYDDAFRLIDRNDIPSLRRVLDEDLDAAYLMRYAVKNKADAKLIAAIREYLE